MSIFFCLEPALIGNGTFYAIRGFVIHQLVNMVSFRKTFYELPFMLPDSLFQVIRDACVERRMFGIGQDINIVLFFYVHTF
jgi:non-homologous end joining protein Ku